MLHTERADRGQRGEAGYSTHERSRQLSLTLCYYDAVLCLSGCGLAGTRLLLSTTVNAVTNKMCYVYCSVFMSPRHKNIHFETLV